MGAVRSRRRFRYRAAQQVRLQRRRVFRASGAAGGAVQPVKPKAPVTPKGGK
jgi:hypothetical protein